jgi:hypothetical protein
VIQIPNDKFQIPNKSESPNPNDKVERETVGDMEI